MRGRRHRPALRAACWALGLAFLVGGCGGGAKAKLSENSNKVAYPAGLGSRRLASVPAVHRRAKTPARCFAATTSVDSSRVAYVAVVKQAAVIREKPQARSRVITRLGRLNENGFREVLGVIAARSGGHCAPGWYRVELSVLPNGTTGWVRAWAVRTYRVRTAHARTQPVVPFGRTDSSTRYQPGAQWPPERAAITPRTSRKPFSLSRPRRVITRERACGFSRITAACLTTATYATRLESTDVVAAKHRAGVLARLWTAGTLASRRDPSPAG